MLREFYKGSDIKVYDYKDKVFPLKINNGELHSVYDENEGMKLFYHEEGHYGQGITVAEEVEAFAYINDEKIIYTSVFHLPPEETENVYITSLYRDEEQTGVLIEGHGLLYTLDNNIIKEDKNQNQKVIYDELEKDQVPLFFEDCFAIGHIYPHSRFEFYRLYDYEGEYLVENSDMLFYEMIYENLIFALINLPADPSQLTKEQKKAFVKLEELRHSEEKPSIDIVDKAICILDEVDLLNEKEGESFKKLVKLFHKYEVEDLALAFQNIMVISYSGKFGSMRRLCSLKNIQRIEEIAKRHPDNFKDIVTDVDLLWNNMMAIKKSSPLYKADSMIKEIKRNSDGNDENY